MNPLLFLLLCFSATTTASPPLRWLGLYGGGSVSSWEGPSACVRAARAGVLAPVQKAACKRNLPLMPLVALAARRVVEECQEAFQRHRWNCSSILRAPHFAPDLDRGTREQAFVSALGSASLALLVGRGCAEGRVATCGCGRPGREPATAHFKWGGCPDNVGFGVQAAKAFTSEPFDRRKFRADVGTRLHRHNSRLGWRAVRSSVRLQCKCHGVSGSCEAQTCWRSLPPLAAVARRLKLRHRDAEEARPTPVGHRRTKLLPTSPHPFSKDHLVYTVKSPDYCVHDPSEGSEGTKGRECNGSSTEDSFGCEAMCCQRGFLTTWVAREERCGCKFRRCCYLTCDTCTIRDNLSFCL